ncbi:MAG: leucine dehydrogenase [Myxococcota bacterium]|jgi:leucine dehydrogenase
MDTLQQIQEMGHEQVVFCHDPTSGLKAIIAIHDTTLGPSLGGCRVRQYANTDEALEDVLRLSRAMTWKSALAGLDLGGGKCVIIGDRSENSEARFRALGRHIQGLGGRYITAEDMNTTTVEMEWVRKETAFVSGLHPLDGGTGDPGPVTAYGTYFGVRACLQHTFGNSDPKGRRVAVQGVGSVGMGLARHLAEAGAELILSDIDMDRARAVAAELGGKAVEPDAFYSADVDVIAPCAIGGVINPKTIPTLKAPIICGAANNILADDERDGLDLMSRNILFAPDFCVNAGGIISVFGEVRRYGQQSAMVRAERIEQTTLDVFARAEADGVPPVRAAIAIAQHRIDSVRALRRI